MKLSSSIRNLVLLAQGQFVTALGTQVFDVAMLLWIKQATGSAALMGFALLFSSLPAAILAPFGGAMADRIGRPRMIVGADVISAGIVGIVLLAYLLNPNPLAMIAILCASNLFLGIMGAGFGPAVNALIPTLAPRRHLERANAAFRFGQTGGSAIGQSLGGLLFGIIGFSGTMALNAASFALSALSESWIRLPERRADTAPSADDTPSHTGTLNPITLWFDTLSAMRSLLRTSRTRTLLWMIAAFHLCFASLPIALPYYVERVLHLDVTWFGVFMAVFSLGILAGFTIAGALKPAKDRLRRAALLALGVALAFGTMAVLSSVIASVMALITIGTGVGMIIVTLMTELQLTTHETQRAAAMGAAQAAGNSSIPVGMALSGLVLDALLRLDVPADLPVRWVIAAAAALAAIAALAGLLGMRNSC